MVDMRWVFANREPNMCIQIAYFVLKVIQNIEIVIPLKNLLLLKVCLSSASKC